MTGASETTATPETPPEGAATTGDLLSGGAPPAPGSQQAPAPESPPAATTPDPANWLATLDDGTRQWATEQGLKTPADLARAHQDLMATALVVPGDDATEEERAAFYQRLGRPEKPDGYDFQKPEDVPSYNDGFADWFRTSAHAAGLSAAQAGALHDHFVAFAKTQEQTAANDRAEAIRTGTAALQQAWGPQQFTAKLEMANRVIADNPGLAARLADFDLANAPELAVILAEYEHLKRGEDTVVSGDSAPLAANIQARIDDLHALQFSDPVKYGRPETQAELTRLYKQLAGDGDGVPAPFARA